MEVVSGNSLLPGDPRLIDHIVCDLKSQGIFDRFRKECIADVDTKPAYQNLRQRVEGSVTSFLKTQQWRPDMNKNQLRESLRKNIYESGFLETGVERIVNQVVNPKINSTFLPEVEDVVYHFLGIEKPQRDNGDKTPSGDGPLTVETTNLLPTDLDPISPDSEVADKSLNKSVTSTEEPEKPDDSKNDEDESPPFEPITEQSFFSTHEDSSNDSHVSGISGLTSHDSNDASSPNETTTKAADLFKLETTNQDSQLSKVSSNSRLSIVTNESKHYSEKMDISDDNTSKSSTKLDGTENGSATAFNMAEINDFKMELEKLKKEEQLKLEPPPNEQIPIIKPDKLEIKEEISESPKISDDINKSDRSKPTSSDSRKRSSSSRKDDRKSDRHHKSSSSSSSKDKHRDKNRDSKSSSSRSKDDSSSKSKSSKHSSSSRDRTNSSSKTESTSKTSSSSRSRSSKSKSESSRTRNENGSSRNSKNDDSRSNSQEKRSSSSSKRDDRTKSDEKRKERSKKDEERTKNDEDKLAQDDSASNKEDKAKMDDKLKKTEDKDETMKSKKDDDESKGKKEEKLKKDEDSEDGKGKKDDSRSKRTKTSDESRKKDETRSKKDDSKSKGSKTSSSSSRSRDSSKHTTTRDRKTSSSSSRDHRKDSKKSKQREDMCSSKPTKPETRRSADRDSNDGSSSIGPSTSSNSSKESSTTAPKPEQSDSSSSQGTNSGNSTGGQSDQQHQQPPGAPLSDSELTKGFKIVRVDLSGVKVDLTSPPPPNSAQPQIAAHPIPPIVKLNKPRFASNIFEARRLMKVRKRMEKMERKRQIQLELSCAKDRSDTSSLDSVDNELTQIVLDTNCGSIRDDLEKVEENAEKEYGEGELESLLSSTGSNLDENGGAATKVCDSTKMAAPVISKASWDELEAKFNNTVDFDSYADEENSSSNTKSDEDFIGFDTEVTKLIPFKQAVDSYEKSLTTSPLTTPKSPAAIIKTKKMGPPRKILKPPSSSKKTPKPDSSIIIIDSSDDEKPKNTTTPDDLLPGKKGKKRKSFPDLLYSENNNKKINNSLTEISGYDPTEYSPSVKIVRNGNIEKTLKTKRLTRSDKAKPTHSSPATDTFPLPLSPESDISASSVDVKKPLEEIVIRPKRVRLGVRGPKVPATKNQQRYSSDDLYKPRPVVCGTSRRQRKLLNNSDKL